MFKDYAKEYITLIQSIYNEQKQHISVNLKGEKAVLIYIYKTKEVTPKDISDYLNVSSARIANNLNKLEEKGFIKRNISKEDRRQIIIDLTEKGVLESEKLIEENLNLFTRILNKLGEEDSKKGILLLHKLKYILNEIWKENKEGEYNVTN